MYIYTYTYTSISVCIISINTGMPVVEGRGVLEVTRQSISAYILLLLLLLLLIIIIFIIIINIIISISMIISIIISSSIVVVLRMLYMHCRYPRRVIYIYIYTYRRATSARWSRASGSLHREMYYQNCYYRYYDIVTITLLFIQYMIMCYYLCY